MGGWIRLGRPGQMGARKNEIEHNYRNLYSDHRIVWSAGERTLSLDEALTRYEEAYLAYFETHLDELQWITTNHANVYDNNPSNVASGLDYHHQEFGGNHYQDIAIRRVAKRLGLSFTGGGLLEIRTKGVGGQWGPGRIPFHAPELIPQPELPGWWNPGSIESYWQSAKSLDVKDPKIDLESADIWFATSNTGKLHSARRALGDQYRVGQAKLHIEEELEDVNAIAKHKAKVAYSSLCRPVIVDDSGFCLHTQENWPGHHVARELKRKGLDYFLILARQGHDRGHWIETVAYHDGMLAKPVLFTTQVHGTLINERRGDEDAPHLKSKLGLAFIKDGQTKTVAEWTPEEAAANSGNRWKQLREYLDSRV